MGLAIHQLTKLYCSVEATHHLAVIGGNCCDIKHVIPVHLPSSSVSCLYPYAILSKK